MSKPAPIFRLAPPFRLALAATLALASTAGATVAAAQPGERPAGDLTRAAFAERASKAFERMDVNRDGQLDPADRAAHQAQRFGKLDADGNGEVSQAEMQAAHDARKAKLAERRSQREARGAERMERRFAMLDQDGSGGVSQAEMDAARKKRGEMRGQRGERGDRAEMRGKRGGKQLGQKGGQHMMRGLIRQADADGDRIVTRAEFDRTVATHFARMDADGNGTLTATERKAARTALRGERRGGGQ